MSDEIEVTGEDLAQPAPLPEKDELTVLKERAQKMGLKVHHKVGVKKLKEQIDAAMKKGNEPAKAEAPVRQPPVQEDRDPAFMEAKRLIDQIPGASIRRAKPPTRQQKIAQKRREANRLIRIRVACMNPNKKDWEGEMYTVSNSVIGTLKKYVPFNAEKGWHVPYIIYQHMKERQCQVFHTVKNDRGQKVRKGKLIKELNIEVLDPLTPKELKALANQQAMANNID